MAKTIFGLVADDGNQGISNKNVDRYASIGVASKTYSYPESASDNGFNVPQILFQFTNPFGREIGNTPTISIKAPTTFNVAALSDYARTENIFGNEVYSGLASGAVDAKVGESFTAGATEAIQNQIKSAGVSGAEAFIYSLKKGLATVAGWGGSAGMNNLPQYEFSQRQSINPMAQLLYKGPQLRRYQFPFTMHPKSAKESANIEKIISIFRVASAPSVPDTGGGVLGSIGVGVGNAFTFGYPHLTYFSYCFVDINGQVKTIHASKLCAIESVSVDYGGQKMTFFGDGRPTEINLVLQLTEVSPRTLGDSIEDITTGTTLL